MASFFAGLSGGLKAFLVIDLILVVGLGVGMIFKFGGGSEDTPTAQPSVSTAAPTVQDTPDPVETEPEETPTTDEDTSFASPTGNILCLMSTESVTCHIANITYSVDQECPQGKAGHEVVLNADGVSTPCQMDESDPPTDPTADVLDYGRSQSVGGYTCTSGSDGMTCVVTDTGQGFRVATAALTRLP